MKKKIKMKHYSLCFLRFHKNKNEATNDNQKDKNIEVENQKDDIIDKEMLNET